MECSDHRWIIPMFTGDSKDLTGDEYNEHWIARFREAANAE